MLSISSQKPHISTVLTNTITYENKTKINSLTADISLPGMDGQPCLSFGLFGLACLRVVVTVVYWASGRLGTTAPSFGCFLHLSKAGRGALPGPTVVRTALAEDLT